MDSTAEKKKHRKRNWKYLEVSERDIKFFRSIIEQKFLRRPEVIEYIFEGKKDYAETRIQKLKRFGYVKAVRILVNEPESYLLDKAGVEALRREGYAVGLNWPVISDHNLPSPQKEIELASYHHDVKVTQVRFLFERLGFCQEWRSEKVLKKGRKGERKVPDGFFTRNGKGIAVEVELNGKEVKTYRRIFYAYGQETKIDFVFYVCGDISLMRRIMKLAREAFVQKKYCFILFDDLMHFKQEAIFRTLAENGKFKLKAVLS